MERLEIINYARIATDIFLIIVIALLVWQFIKADAMVKDIALYDKPESLVQTYENITGYSCMCGEDMMFKVQDAINKKDTTIRFNLSNLNP